MRKTTVKSPGYSVGRTAVLVAVAALCLTGAGKKYQYSAREKGLLCESGGCRVRPARPS